MTQNVKVTLVELAQPCTACLITSGLIKEMLKSIKNNLPYVILEYISLKDLKQAHLVEGLEVENFPALLINNEQITAGSLPLKRQLISLIEMEAEDDE